jgi:5'-AMP-activated protein kinase regulatory beta subunit
MKKKLKFNGAQAFAFTAPGAVSVQLVGDFTHWLQNPIHLHKGARGIWRTQVDLAPGTYHYKFIVDGEWHDDPECVLRVANPFGGENMVCKVEGEAQ